MGIASSCLFCIWNIYISLPSGNWLGGLRLISIVTKCSFIQVKTYTRYLIEPATHSYTCHLLVPATHPTHDICLGLTPTTKHNILALLFTPAHWLCHPPITQYLHASSKKPREIGSELKKTWDISNSLTINIKLLWKTNSNCWHEENLIMLTAISLSVLEDLTWGRSRLQSWNGLLDSWVWQTGLLTEDEVTPQQQDYKLLQIAIYLNPHVPLDLKKKKK